MTKILPKKPVSKKSSWSPFPSFSKIVRAGMSKDIKKKIQKIYSDRYTGEFTDAASHQTAVGESKTTRRL